MTFYDGPIKDAWIKQYCEQHSLDATNKDVWDMVDEIYYETFSDWLDSDD